MHQGNWPCSGCGGTITELPFEPRSEAGLLCRDCHSKKRAAPGSGGAAAADASRPRFEGQWSCADCGGAITSLPFEPRNTSNLRCLDCFKKSRA